MSWPPDGHEQGKRDQCHPARTIQLMACRKKEYLPVNPDRGWPVIKAARFPGSAAGVKFYAP